MVKVLDCVCQLETACACLRNGRDMRDMPSIGDLAINTLSSRFGVKCAAKMCERWWQCVVLWCEGQLSSGRRDRVRLPWFPPVFATQGYHFGGETPCDFPELAVNICSISGVLAEIVS